MKSNHARILGGGFWLAVLVGTGIWMTRITAAPDAGVDHPLLQSVAVAGPAITLIDPTGQLRVGDSAFLQTASPSPTPTESFTQVGDVISVREMAGDSGNEIRLRTYRLDAPAQQFVFRVHESSGRMEDVVATLIPRHKRELLVRRITAAMGEHGDEITAAMMPIVIESVTASLPIIETQLRDSLARHDDEVQALLTRYQQEIIQDRLVPLAREEIVPIMKRYGSEPAETIGREIWGRASLWRFGWRAVYDQAPLPKRDMVQEEWRRFVDEEVLPIIESHMDEIVVAIQRTMMDVADNPRLRQELTQMVAKISNDPDTRELIRTILDEAVLHNAELRDVWAVTWTSPRAKAALKLAGQRIEPVLRQVADEVLGTRESGIEPGFARVLRNQVLGKDRTWITLERRPADEASDDITNDAPIRLTVAERFSVYPVVHLAGD